MFGELAQGHTVLVGGQDFTLFFIPGFLLSHVDQFCCIVFLFLVIDYKQGKGNIKNCFCSEGVRWLPTQQDIALEAYKQPYLSNPCPWPSRCFVRGLGPGSSAIENTKCLRTLDYQREKWRSSCSISSFMNEAVTTEIQWPVPGPIDGHCTSRVLGSPLCSIKPFSCTRQYWWYVNQEMHLR